MLDEEPLDDELADGAFSFDPPEPDPELEPAPDPPESLPAAFPDPDPDPEPESVEPDDSDLAGWLPVDARSEPFEPDRESVR